MNVLAFPKPMSRQAASVEDAQRRGIDALALMAGHDDLERRFPDVAGYDARQIRGDAEKASCPPNVLDFTMANEGDLIDFADVVNRAPRGVGPMCNMLALSVGIPSENYSI